MKTLHDYIAETEQWIDGPSQGDTFEIDIREGEYIIETYVVDDMDDGIVIHGDERVMELLEQAGYTFEEIRRYGPVGSSPATGHTVAEGGVKDIDIERQDYERMNPQQFYAAYKMSKDQWKDKNKEILEPETTDKAHWDFGRILELAGVADHKFDKEDDIYSEDQSAAVLAKKEVDSAITDPMPEIHEDPSKEDMEEAKYQGREVPLGKPMRGDVKKSKVYVRGPKGNVVKVNFGDKTMKIKKSNPKRRKSFRARHNCDNPGPRWKARYWSCRAW